MKCAGCFKDGYEGFCNPCKKELFGGKNVSHILPFNSPEIGGLKKFQNNTKRISISGVQLKYSLQLKGDELKLTDTGGQYILKPIPKSTFDYLDHAPANEHVCMQLAKQIYKLETPPNALVYFKDGVPAYLVKRFDVSESGDKKRQEDFASLAGKTPDGKGDFKYDYSYEGIGKLMKTHLPAYAIEVEKFFRLVVFNYIIGNGDAHLKNFSVSETSIGDHRLSPTYDLMCTRLHIAEDSDMALDLFEGDYSSETYDANGFFKMADFLKFGDKLGMKPKRVMKIIDSFTQNLPGAIALIERSFLEKSMQLKLIKQIQDYTELRLS